MGFDLHGMNPKSATPEPIWEKEDPWDEASAKSFKLNPQLKKEYDKYIADKIKWQDSTEGAYFRNNVWWWRPLWQYVCDNCEDILTPEDVERGSYNDGHVICKTKAKSIARILRKLIKEGHTDAYTGWHDNKREEMGDKDWNRHYPFNVQNVRVFERFCEQSGGFDIC